MDRVAKRCAFSVRFTEGVTTDTYPPLGIVYVMHMRFCAYVF